MLLDNYRLNSGQAGGNKPKRLIVQVIHERWPDAAKHEQDEFIDLIFP
jgi:hypothetical protein